MHDQERQEVSQLNNLIKLAKNVILLPRSLDIIMTLDFILFKLLCIFKTVILDFLESIGNIVEGDCQSITPPI